MAFESISIGHHRPTENRARRSLRKTPHSQPKHSPTLSVCSRCSLDDRLRYARLLRRGAVPGGSMERLALETALSLRPLSVGYLPHVLRWLLAARAVGQSVSFLSVRPLSPDTCR